jgi:hypothetical protein
VNLVEIKIAVIFERVSELSPDFFRDFRIKEEAIYTVFIHFVPFLNMSYTSVNSCTFKNPVLVSEKHSASSVRSNVPVPSSVCDAV